MRIETLAVHAGYSPDPTTKAVAVPMYQTVAYSFDNAQHGADCLPTPCRKWESRRALPTRASPKRSKR